METQTEKKTNKIKEFLEKDLEKGDLVHVRGLGIQNKSNWGSLSKVEITSDEYIIIEGGQKILNGDWKKYTGIIGENPFPETKDRISNINYSLDSILFSLGLTKEKTNSYEIKGITVSNVNFNPFVLEPKKEYYQRPLVWGVSEKKNLIESIYQNVDCGKILIRNRGWKELELMAEKGETDLSWKDIVDGKQRLHTMYEFINNEFTDNYGNYFGDLSDQAQNRLFNHQLFSYSELPENTTDKDVLNQFLKLNFAGIPQSIEHINFVKGLL